MSAFYEIADELGRELSQLSKRSQVLVFAAAARALQPTYVSWAGSAGHRGQAILDRAIALATGYSISGRTSDDANEVLRYLNDIVNNPADDLGQSTAAQDCWICADIGLRIPTEDARTGDSLWYILEPILQSTSYRVTGFTSAGGSEAVVNAVEKQLLEEPVLKHVVSSIRSSLSYLRKHAEPSTADVEHVLGQMSAIAPDPIWTA